METSESLILTFVFFLAIVFLMFIAVLASKYKYKLIADNHAKIISAPPDFILVVNSSIVKYNQLVFAFDGPNSYEQTRLFWQMLKKAYPIGATINMDCYYCGVYKYSHEFKPAK